MIEETGGTPLQRGVGITYCKTYAEAAGVADRDWDSLSTEELVNLTNEISNKLGEGRYGGTRTYLSELPVGTKFHVCNGAWDGKIVSKGEVKCLQIGEGEYAQVTPLIGYMEDYVLWIDIEEVPDEVRVDMEDYCAEACHQLGLPEKDWENMSLKDLETEVDWFKALERQVGWR